MPFTVFKQATESITEVLTHLRAHTEDKVKCQDLSIYRPQYSKTINRPKYSMKTILCFTKAHFLEETKSAAKKTQQNKHKLFSPLRSGKK